jgi:Cas7 group CRISPR-associated protein Csh2
MKNAPFNRHVGLIILEVNHSNPNGDPDLESDPRTLEADGRGIISPVSFKRKIRDLVLENGLVMDQAREKLSLGKSGDSNNYNILESRGRDRKTIIKMDKGQFSTEYWDARVFGNTFLESAKDDPEARNRDMSHFISTGVIQVGVGMSVCPVTIDRMTNTNKSGVEEGKDRGMAPLAFRVVRHGIYAIPFFINPSMAERNGTTQKDIDLFEFIAPIAYSQTASAVRNDVRCLHIWRGIHKSPLGSCPDHLFLEAFTPKSKEKGAIPETRDGYSIPAKSDLSDELISRFETIDDLCFPKG